MMAAYREMPCKQWNISLQVYVNGQEANAKTLQAA